MTNPTEKDLLILLTMWVSPTTLLLLVVSLYLIQPKVEAKLTSHVKSILIEHNINADVSFSGRDGTLTGYVASQEIAEKAHMLSLAVFGARIIKNHLMIGSSQQQSDTLVSESPHIKKAIYHKTSLVANKSTVTSEVDKIILAMSQQAQAIPSDKSNKNAVTSSSIVTPALIVRKKTIKPIEQIKDTKKAIKKVINKERQPKPHQVKAVPTLPLNNKSKAKQHQKKTVATLAIKKSKKAKRVLKKKTKSKNKKSKKTIIAHASTPKKTHDVLMIIDDFNLSLDAFTKPKTKKTMAKKHQPVVQSSLSHNKINLSSIRFSNTTTHVLPASAYPLLNKIVQLARKQSYPSIEIIAYANDSDIAYARGVAVRTYLVKQGLRKNSVHVAGHMMINSAGKHLAFKLLSR